MSDEVTMNEVLQAIHDAEKAGEPIAAEGLAVQFGEDVTTMSTRVFGALNSGFAERYSDGGLTLTDSGRAQIGVTDG